MSEDTAEEKEERAGGKKDRDQKDGGREDGREARARRDEGKGDGDGKKARAEKDEGKGDGDGKKGKPWKRILLGVGVLVVVIVVAVVALGGSSKKKATPGGTLKAGKQQLLPIPPSGRLAVAPGVEVTGEKLVVRSIVKGKGFFVGGSNVNRVYVLYAGPTSQVGGTVGLKGVVKPAPGDVAKTLKLTQQDAAKVTAEGGYVNASTVTAGP